MEGEEEDGGEQQVGALAVREEGQNWVSGKMMPEIRSKDMGWEQSCEDLEEGYTR